MSRETTVQSAVTPTFSIVINGEDAAGNPTTKTWKLCLDYRALAAIEDATNRDLKKIENWKDISSGKEFPQIIHCCLRRYNPDVTLDDVLENLNPQAQLPLSDALFCITFPGVVEAFKKQKEDGATAVPNEQTATQST
ncbi:MAG TPA: hypothetical protein VKR59_07935 [Terriglobales bacterium]|nr:hypothetical protein [Terriglobales bacterium]